MGSPLDPMVNALTGSGADDRRRRPGDRLDRQLPALAGAALVVGAARRRARPGAVVGRPGRGRLRGGDGAVRDGDRGAVASGGSADRRRARRGRPLTAHAVWMPAARGSSSSSAARRVTGAGSPRDGLAVGRDPRGRAVRIPVGYTSGRHTLVVGATGSGKTVTQAWIAARLIEAGHGAVVIDPKGDRLLHDELERAARKARRTFRVWSPEGPGSTTRSRTARTPSWPTRSWPARPTPSRTTCARPSATSATPSAPSSGQGWPVTVATLADAHGPGPPRGVGARAPGRAGQAPPTPTSTR